MPEPGHRFDDSRFASHFVLSPKGVYRRKMDLRQDVLHPSSDIHRSHALCRAIRRLRVQQFDTVNLKAADLK